MSFVINILGQNYFPEQSGNAPYTTSLAEGLTTRGHRVAVHTTDPYYPDWNRAPSGSKWKSIHALSGVRVVRRKQYVPGTPSAIRRLLSEISFGLRLLTGRIDKSDVVLLVSPSLFSSALALVRFRLKWRRPAVGIWVQDLYSRGVVEIGVGGKFTARVIHWIESWVLKRADGVAVIHDRFARQLTNSLAIPPERITVIRNWSHLELPKPVDRDRVRAELGWRPGEVVVLHCGNQGAKQGLAQLRPIAERIEKDGLPIRIVLLGDGNQRESLQALLCDYACVDFIAPLPPDDFQAAMAAADILLVCEREDLREMSVPSKLTSYFSTGRPVIALTDLAGITAEEIETSGAGVCVQATDVSGFVEQVRILSTDEQQRTSLGAAGLEYRAAVLSKDSAVSSFETWLAGLSTSRD